MDLLTRVASSSVDVLTACLRLLRELTQSGIEFVEGWFLDSKKARYGVAITRMLLGITAIGLLVSDWRTRYYLLGSGSAWNGEKIDPTSQFGGNLLFDLFRSSSHSDLALTLIMVLLLCLAVIYTLGWRMRIIGILFFFLWVSFIALNRPLGNQGDNIMRISMLFLLFTDSSAVWSLDARRKSVKNSNSLAPEWLTNVFHNAAIALLIIQICIVYAAGGLYKATGAPWQNGTAVYGPLATMRYSPWPELNEIFVAWGPLVLQATWTSVLLQVFFAMMLLRRITRILALIGIGSFHIGIGVLMGLPWFSLSMLAIDSVLIRDKTWKNMADYLSATWRKSGVRRITREVNMDGVSIG